MDSIEFQLLQHKKFLQQRAVDRIVQSALFSDVWDHASAIKRRTAKVHISSLSVYALHRWLYDDFENHTVRELRQLASHNSVKNYCLMSKAELIQYFLEKGITDGRDEETTIADETFAYGGEHSEPPNTHPFWKT